MSDDTAPTPVAASSVGYKVVDAQWNPSRPADAQAMLTSLGDQGWSLITAYPSSIRERTRWILSQSGVASYHVVDQQWSPSDPQTIETFLNSQGSSGWQLIMAYPDSQREKTRWIFGQGTAAGGGGGVPEAPVDGNLYGRENAAWVVVPPAGTGPAGPAGPQGPAGPAGPQGATGAAGPSAVSANAGNTATLGTDSLIFVPAPAAPPAPSSTPPVMDGIAAIGTAATYARADHVHPANTSTLGIGRNKLHNPLFNIQQRGQGPWTAIGYTADRWATYFASDTDSISIVGLSDADRAAIGDEEARYALQDVFTGSAAAGSYSFITQTVETTRRLSGKTITVSFWARATVGTPKLGVAYTQGFGTGGSPSANVSANIGATPALSAAWARYSFTITLPSVAGKTFGTSAGTDGTACEIWYSSNYTPDRSGGIGVQSGTVQIWGVQLETGSQATPLEKTDPRYDLANCQRFYQTGGGLNYVYQAAGGTAYTTVPFVATMRAPPTATVSPSGGSNYNSVTVGSTNISSLTVNTVVTATGGSAYTLNWTVSADL